MESIQAELEAVKRELAELKARRREIKGQLNSYQRTAGESGQDQQWNDLVREEATGAMRMSWLENREYDLTKKVHEHHKKQLAEVDAEMRSAMVVENYLKDLVAAAKK